MTGEDPEVSVPEILDREKCIRLPAQSARMTAKCHSSRRKVGQCSAGTAIQPREDSKNKQVIQNKHNFFFLLEIPLVEFQYFYFRIL